MAHRENPEEQGVFPVVRRLTPHQRRASDPFNGLLLTPAYGHCFDLGFIGFGDDGALIVAGGAKTAKALALLGIRTDTRFFRVEACHLSYLREHRRRNGL